MSPYNRYLFSLASLFMATTVLLAVYRQRALDLYFSAYLIEYLAVTLLFVHLHPQARHLLSLLGYILFGGFLGIVALKVGQVLGLWGVS